MGEVYRARDTRLGRDVAVKVLPERLASDPVALARFTREARAVAQLSHPSIRALHDIGTEGGTPYAVMELLEGETLGARLRDSSGIAPRAAVDIGTAVALGLAEAHDKGIVHRDLKPENVFLVRDGRVKILDFGLARTMPGSLRELGGTDVMTREGLVVGTAGYMSPEQVRGKTVDHRSDIFSFGCVLYEMLAGARAFTGGSPVETMSAILDRNPASIAELRPGVPVALLRVVERCLEKLPEQRFQSARDLAFALSNAAEASSPTATLATAVVVPAVTPVAARRVLPPRPGTGARVRPLLAVLTVGVLAFLAGRLLPGPPHEDALPSGRFHQLTDLPGVEQTPRLSPDGKMLAFVGRSLGNADIYVQRVGGHNPIALTKDCREDDTAPAFSPDGERIAFRSECEGGGVFLMGATGESRRRVTDAGYDPSFSADGRYLVVASEATTSPLTRFSPQSRLTVIEVASGRKRELTAADGMQPAWSPHGHRIAFWGLRGPQSRTGQRDLFTVSVDGGEPVEVTSDPAVDWSPAWSPDGRYLYFSSGRGGTMNLWRVALDERTGRVLGEPVPITTPTLWCGWPSLSSAGTLAFAAQEERSVIYRVPFDPERGELAGEPSVILAGSRIANHVALSRDASVVAFTGGPVALTEKLYTVRTDGTAYAQLLDDDWRNRMPRWSPDGTRIVFFSNRGGAYEIWSVKADGGRLMRLAAEPQQSLYYPSFSRDGTRLVANNYDATRIYEQGRPEGQGAVTTLPRLAADRTFFGADWSPDGSRLLGFAVRPDGVAEGIYTYTFASAAYQTLSPASTRWTLWLPDGQRLLYATQRGALCRLDGSGREPRELLPPGTLAGDVGTFGLSADGRLLVYLKTTREADVWMIR